jgi:hypothetical protein
MPFFLREPLYYAGAIILWLQKRFIRKCHWRESIAISGELYQRLTKKPYTRIHSLKYIYVQGWLNLIARKISDLTIYNRLLLDLTI